MKTLILSIAILSTVLFSCQKEENIIHYKYAYIHQDNVQDSAKIKIVTTHLRPYKTILTTAEVNRELKQIRQNKPSYVLIDTLVLIDDNVNKELYKKLKNRI